MRRSIVGLTVLALVAAGAQLVLAGDQCSDPSSKSVASPAAQRGKILGRFDPAMSGVCRFGCATSLKYKTKDVHAQPGAKAGKLTQCPISGVVFAVDANRPRVHIASEDYVTCCDKCATKLKSKPRQYLRV